MKDIIKPTKKKNETVYKSLYIKEDLVKKLEIIAKEHDTSFNNVVISLLVHFARIYKLHTKKYQVLIT